MNPESKLSVMAANVAPAQPLAKAEIFELTVDNSTYSIVLPHAATDYIQRKLATEHVPYELEMLRDMQSRLSSGDMVLDAGANIGNHTLFLASVMGCHVAAFEPNQELSSALLSSVKLNDLSDQVNVCSHALGKANATGHFVKEIPDNLGGQSIESGDGPIKIQALDTIRFEKKVKAIKIDVEGMELDVLRGGSGLIDKDRPVLYVECQTEENFRTIGSWLTKKNYSYWDTFNATPTHLFLPNEQTTVDQRLAQLHFKVEQGEYQSAQKITALRQKLDDANLKYRASTEQVAALKGQLSQEETTRLATVRELEQNQTQLTESKAKLQEESTALYETEKQLIGLQAKFEAIHDLLEDADQKHRSATEQIATLKQRIVEEELAHTQVVSLVAQLRQQLATAQQELEATRALHRSDQHQNEQLKLSGLQTKRELANLQSTVESLRQQKIAAENQVAKTRAMLSFQLGYRLLHGFKSFRAFTQLPGQLLALRQEAKRRRSAGASTATRQSMPAAKASREPKSEPLAPSPLAASHAPATLALPETAFVQALKSLKVACIMDEFTFSSYRPECNLLQLSVQHWQAELETFTPELLFIESAWRGKDDQWGSKVGHMSEQVVGIVEWCRGREIPTVFWNKEDPVHFETFLSTAKMFDYVFTTDIDCIHRYKAALGHERVYLLPFACQPECSNPLEAYQRKDAFCFAGAYYVRYPERTRDLGNFVSALAEYRPVEIYDRNYGKDDPNYQFPPEYQPFIIGNLPFDQIDKAYKGYRYAINLNSIKQSQSMFARRVFELLASNTVTVSNFSRGVRLLFGDLVITTDNGSEVVRRLQALGGDDVQLRKFRLAGLRKVMNHHTYQDRLAYVVSKVQGKANPKLLPTIAVTAYAKSQEQFDALLASYNRQSYADRRFIVVVPGGFSPERVPVDQNVQVMAGNAIDELKLGELTGGGELLAGIVPDDYYGPNYLLDLALATRYSTAQAIGKVTHHVWSASSGLSLAFPGCQYLATKSIPARCALTRPALVPDMPLREWVTSLYTRQIEAPELLSVDEFNYCKNGGTASFDATQADAVNDLAGLDQGLAAEELIARGERIAPEEATPDGAPVLTGERLASYFKPPTNKGYTLTVAGSAWEAESTLADGKHDYLYAATDLRPVDLGFNAHAEFHLDTAPGLNLQLVMLFLDAQKQRISHVVKPANRNQDAAIPPGTEWIRLGLRIYGGGAARINALVLGHRPLRPAEVLGRAEHLLLTNHYPSYDDLYRNGFVHSRVAAYAERGTPVDVFRLRNGEGISYHEFYNVDVITGSQEALHKLLAGGHYKSVLVHFLDEAMWQVLQQYIGQIKIFVWVHGAEIQPWHRRDYNFANEQEREAAKIKSDVRMSFWRGLLEKMPANLKLIFVSNYFAEEVMEDLGFRLPKDSYEIIHNPIDTDLFAYHRKPAEQRKKILSIRPYTSRTYANDLTVKAILALSEKPFFKDLEFRLIGDGKLFDEILEPLREFRNVCIERRFLTHAEIAALHRAYGVFLCPTRMDTQGVSRDEAMSSGLVPVTNAVAAVPEFVNPSCGHLADAEDAEGLAHGIEFLYKNEEEFTAMSESCHKQILESRATEQIVESELTLFRTPLDRVTATQ